MAREGFAKNLSIELQVAATLGAGERNEICLGVTSIVVGPRTPEHLQPVREALALDLTPAERDEVGSFFS